MRVGVPQHEDELVVACQKGDASAADALVDLYWKRLYAFSYRLTLNANDAEDITQETLLRALNNIQKYKPEERFKAWLFRIATNLFVDQRKGRRSRDVSTDDVEKFAGPSTEQSPAEKLDQKELLSALQSTMLTLSREQQIVVLLRAMEQLDYPEIAAVLQTKEATARWHMYEARRILRQKLSRKFDLEAFTDE